MHATTKNSRLISVSEAIKNAHLFISLPIALLIIGSTFIIEYLYNDQLDYLNASLLGIILGVILAWMYWSFAITKWRIWAYKNVEHIHLLTKTAISNHIIWPPAHFFSKTEIVLPPDRLILETLQERLKKPDTYTVISALPKQTEYYYTASYLRKRIAYLATYIIIVVTLFYFDFIGIFLSIGIFVGIIFTPLSHAIKNLNNTKFQLQINERGITFSNGIHHSWNSIQQFYFKDNNLDCIASKTLMVEYKNPVTDQILLTSQDLINLEFDKSTILMHLHSYQIQSKN